MCELGVESVETLFLALPEMSGQDTFKVLKEFWEVRFFFPVFNLMFLIRIVTAGEERWGWGANIASLVSSS